MNINETLKQRNKTHGDFETHANLSQALKNTFAEFNQSLLTDDQQEAIDMIFHKLARIGNGHPNIHDHWHDIAGYATLVANRLYIPCCSSGDDIDCQQGRNCPRAIPCDK